MHATNYFKKTKEWVKSTENLVSSEKVTLSGDSQRVLNLMSEIVELFDDAEKFILPENGKIFDCGLKGLNENTLLRLPFPKVVMEFVSDQGTRHVVCAMEAKKPDSEEITIRVYNLMAPKQNMTAGMLPVVCYLEQKPVAGQKEPTFLMLCQDIRTTGFMDKDDEENATLIEDAMILSARPVLELIEALSCKNVTSEYLPHKHSAAKHAALGFDEYRVLTVRTNAAHATGDAKCTGGHASPREHLRRGHIRRHPTAGNIWINSMVVNAGVGGKIHKTYKMEAA